MTYAEILAAEDERAAVLSFLKRRFSALTA
jgi:hypothetical protein